MIRLKLTLLISIFIQTSASYAQSLRYPVALPYISLSAYTRQQTDAFSFTGNQAALAQIKNFSIGVYGERRFGLQATSSYSAALAAATTFGNFGVQMNYAGFTNFNENKVGLAYAKSLGKKVDIGIQFNYYGYRIPAYGNASAINAEAGILLHLSDKLTTGLQVYNPVGGKLGKTGDEKLASAYKVGIGYDASDNFFISTEIIKEEDKAINVAGGVQYHFARQFFARLGFLSESSTAFAGVGIGFGNIRLDVAGSYHPQLGFSPGIMLVSNFGEKK
ncbi:MAG: hypothetical protein IPJ81_11630 [Chitinophagaceae bacterium]|nr:hypothetical protein [Chitinophagaceae bacterium]